MVERLADLTGRPIKPLNGTQKTPAVARIDEPVCIGCTLCIRACPVDAIVGAVNAMHTVIAAECSGCELCLPACPVDCIAMIDPGMGRQDDPRARAAHYKRRYLARETRLERDRRERISAAGARAEERRRRTTIDRVLERARQRLERWSRS